MKGQQKQGSVPHPFARSPVHPFIPRRGLAVGVALIVLNGYFSFYASALRSVSVTSAAPYANVIFLLFLLVGLNALIARIRPHLALGTADLLAVYVMLSIQTGLGDARTLHGLIAVIAGGYWGATESNRWSSDWLPHLPPRLMVTDPEALRGYFLGHATLFTPRNLQAWLLPMLWWTLLIYTLAAVLVAVSALFSRQWVRRERLSFPIVELPFQMVAAGTPFWRQRRMWIGFGLASAVEIVNGLSFLYPSVPYLPLKRTNLSPWFVQPPWNALGETHLSFYPFVVGLSFLMPFDLSLSLWFFYLFHKAQLLAGGTFGWTAIPEYPFITAQQFGAGVALVAGALWSARAHLRWAWRLAWERPNGSTPPASLEAQRTAEGRGEESEDGTADERRYTQIERKPPAFIRVHLRSSAVSNSRPSPRLSMGLCASTPSEPEGEGETSPGSSSTADDDLDERRLYRRSWITLAVGSVAAMGWMIAAGLTWWAAIVVYGMVVLMGLVVARIRCELGSPVHVLWVNGERLLMVASGAQVLGMRNVTLLGLFDSFTRWQQGHVLPHQLEGFKLADRAGVPARALVTAMILAILVTVPVTFFVNLETLYRLGAGSAHLERGEVGYWEAPRVLYDTILPAWGLSDVYQKPNTLVLGVMGGSFLVATALLALRYRYLGFPLHPVGLALATSGAGVGDIVTSLFAGSLLKGLVLRYGGLAGYRYLLPFFLGLILGDLVTGMAWVALGLLLGLPTYVFFL